jgi:hypothetical protein
MAYEAKRRCSQCDLSFRFVFDVDGCMLKIMTSADRARVWVLETY